MRNPAKRRPLFALCIVLLVCAQAQAEMTLVLSAHFVHELQNSATITVNLEIDARSPLHGIGTGGKDGDIHVAGRADEVELPLVAEVMNARMEKQKRTVQRLRDAKEGDVVKVRGAWRIWFEHPGQGEMVQGAKVPKPSDGNPAHVFEIHPIVEVGENHDPAGSLVPIRYKDKEYQAYPASKAFSHYESRKATIEVTESAYNITSSRSVLNYAEFIIELTGKPEKVSDGSFVLANVFDSDNEEEPVVGHPVRMVFIDQTPPARELRGLKKGNRLHVMGVPRVNLAEVAALEVGANVEMKLPYEMIIVAVLPDRE